MSDESRVKSLFAGVKTKFDKAHVLINCAISMTLGLVGDVSIASYWSDYVRSSLHLPPPPPHHPKKKSRIEHVRCVSDGF